MFPGAHRDEQQVSKSITVTLAKKNLPQTNVCCVQDCFMHDVCNVKEKHSLFQV